MATEDAALGDRPNSNSPMPAAGIAVELIASQTLTQDFGDTVSTVVGVGEARRVALWVSYDGGSSASGGYPQIKVLLSAAASAPATTADSWYAPGLIDATPTDADLGGGLTLVTDADYTAGPEWREVKVGPMVLRLFGTDDGEAVRLKLSVDVTDARWMYVTAAEVGATSNDGDIAIDWSIAL